MPSSQFALRPGRSSIEAPSICFSYTCGSGRLLPFYQTHKNAELGWEKEENLYCNLHVLLTGSFFQADTPRES